MMSHPVELMSAQPPPYQARLSEAQTLFRTTEKTQAFERMRALLDDYPEAEPVEKFYGATARYIESVLRKSVQASEHEMMIHYGRMLLCDARFHDRAESAVLEAARATLPAADRVVLLQEVCHDRPDLTDYWREIGRCLSELPADNAMIELGFATRVILPDDSIALAGLAALVARATDTPTDAET